MPLSNREHLQDFLPPLPVVMKKLLKSGAHRFSAPPWRKVPYIRFACVLAERKNCGNHFPKKSSSRSANFRLQLLRLLGMLGGILLPCPSLSVKAEACRKLLLGCSSSIFYSRCNVYWALSAQPLLVVAPLALSFVWRILIFIQLVRYKFPYFLFVLLVSLR